MKKSLLAILLCVFGCTHPEGLNRYILKMSKSDQDIIGKQISKRIEIDTIIAPSDTVAYTKAVESFISMLKTDSIYRYRLTKVHTFEITDLTSTPLQLRLSKKTTDSIYSRISGQMLR